MFFDQYHNESKKITSYEYIWNQEYSKDIPKDFHSTYKLLEQSAFAGPQGEVSGLSGRGCILLTAPSFFDA